MLSSIASHRIDPRPLLRAGMRQQFGRGGQHHLDDLVARQMQRGPIIEALTHGGIGAAESACVGGL